METEEYIKVDYGAIAQNKYHSILDYYNKMSEFEKLELYMEYYIKVLGYDNTLSILNVKPKQDLFICSDSDKISYDTDVPSFKGTHLRWGSFTYNKFNSLKEYCNTKNIKLVDHGKNWKERYWATRYTLNTQGIYKDIERLVSGKINVKDYERINRN